MRLPCIAAALVACLTVAVNGRIPANVVADWLVLPPGCPTNIKNLQELEEFKRHHHYFVSGWMVGGFGNELFQMAAALSLSQQRNIACIVGYWDHENYNPYGTRTPPAPGITIKHIFPNIIYLDYLPKYNLHGISTSEIGHHQFPDNEQLLKTPIITGAFMHPDCLCRNISQAGQMVIVN